MLHLFPNKRNFIMLLVILVVNTSCKSVLKDVYLHSFERFIEKVEKNCRTYSEDDWNRKDERFAYYERKCNEYSGHIRNAASMACPIRGNKNL